MKKITVQLSDDQKIVVSELPLIKYAELIKSLEILPKKLSGLSGKNSEQILDMILPLIGEALPDFVNIIAVATDMKKEDIEQLGLSGIVRIVEAIVKVNDYQYLFDIAKKGFARYQASKPGLKSQE